MNQNVPLQPIKKVKKSIGQSVKNAWLGGGDVIVKTLTALKTGFDTYLVSTDLTVSQWKNVKFELPALLNVILLDGIFMYFWANITYGGEGDIAMSKKPWHAVGAWLMYFIMLAVGWEALPDLLSIGVRIGIGILLLIDTWQFRKMINIQQARETIEQYRERLMKRAMKQAFKKEITSKDNVAFRKVAKAITFQDIATMAEDINPGIIELMSHFQNGNSQNKKELSALESGQPYVTLPDGNIHCLVCGWTSHKNGNDNYNAKFAYSRHVISRRHKSAVP